MITGSWFVTPLSHDRGVASPIKMVRMGSVVSSAAGVKMQSSNAEHQPRHGARVLGHVIVDSYNTEIRDEQGLIGDRANKRAFQARVDEWRSRLRDLRDDPLEGRPTRELYQDKRALEEILLSGETEAAGVLLGAIEDYAHALAGVVHRLLETEGWQRTERIAVGGGFREGRIGELAIGRASVHHPSHFPPSARQAAATLVGYRSWLAQLAYSGIFTSFWIWSSDLPSFMAAPTLSSSSA
jgi:hypothetical protein